MNIVHLKKGESAKTYDGSVFVAPVTGVYVDYRGDVEDTEFIKIGDIGPRTGWVKYEPSSLWKDMREYQNRINELTEALSRASLAPAPVNYISNLDAQYITFPDTHVGSSSFTTSSGTVTLTDTSDSTFNLGEREDE
jgi:hypothetical protein